MIDISKKYKTRDGKEVRIYAIDHFGDYPICGAIKEEYGWENSSWTKDGKFREGRLHISYSIVEVSKYEDFKIDDKVIVWDNDYPNSKKREYFAGVNEDGMPMTFCEGRTSFTTASIATWDNCEKYDPLKHGE